MRSKNNEVMDKIVAAANEYFGRTGRIPSTRALAAAVGLSHNTVARYLREMGERGMIDYSSAHIITDNMARCGESVGVPVVGWISCGAPLDVEQNVTSYMFLPREIVGSGEFYIVTADGDSMTGAGIDDGDSVIVRRCDDAADGDIVVALADGANTLKRFFRDRARRKVILRAENDRYADIVTDECIIQGVAVKVIKNL